MTEFSSNFSVRTSRSQDSISHFPHKLFSVKQVDSEESSPTDDNMRCDPESYVLSEASLRMWGFPISLPQGMNVMEMNYDDNRSYSSSGKSCEKKRCNFESSRYEYGSDKRFKTDDESCQTSYQSTGDSSQSQSPQSSSDDILVSFSPPECNKEVFVSLEDAREILAKYGIIEDVYTGSSKHAAFCRTLPESTVQEIEDFLHSKSSTVTSSSRVRSIVAVDCEMCETLEGLEVTRVTVVDNLNKILFDSLVKPDRPIINYRTAFSGITENLLSSVTTKLCQVQVALIRMISEDSILVGHSLDNDLKALQLSHRRCIDTAVLFPHARGYPYRMKLKQLAEEFLQLKIQRGASHDSAEDARAAMQLVMAKLEHGPQFGIKSSILNSLRSPFIANFECFPFQASFLWSWKDHSFYPAMIRDCVNGAITPHHVPVFTEVVEGNVEQLINVACDFICRNKTLESSTVQKSSTIAAVSDVNGDDVDVSANNSSKNTNNNSDNSSLTKDEAQDASLVDSLIPSRNLCVICIRRGELNEIGWSLSKIIQKMMDCVYSRTKNRFSTLFLLSSQPSLERITSMQKRKQACQHPMSTSIWTPELELELRERITMFHKCKVHATVRCSMDQDVIQLD